MAAIHDAVSALHGDEKYTDLTVTCGEHTFKLHRAIICPQSPFFEKSCSGGFVEASTGHINLSEEDPETFRKFIQFIYTGNYDDEDHLSPEGCDEAVLQPVDQILSSLRHGIDIPGFNLYCMKLWNDPETEQYHRYDSWKGGDVCKRCGGCLCHDCDRDGSKLCEYRSREEAYRCFEADSEDYSSDEDEDLEDDEMDGGFPLAELKKRPTDTLPSGLTPDELVYPDDDGYVTDFLHAMFTSARVYAMADMFCVPALKVLARNRFYKAVERHVDWPDFPDVVDEVFETTGPDDWVLKEICVLFIRSRSLGKQWDGELMEALQPVFCRHEDLVRRLQLLPELEGRYFEDGQLHTNEADDAQDGVDVIEESLGWVSLPDKTPPIEQEED